MTRVNLVPPQELFDQHLMAEYREIPMVIGSLKRSLASVGGVPMKLRIPPTFRLNSGHVSFFYNKGRWLFVRYFALVDELKLRGYAIRPGDRAVDWGIFARNSLLDNNWKPSEEDIAISRQRIEERVAQKPEWYRKTEYSY